MFHLAHRIKNKHLGYQKVINEYICIYNNDVLCFLGGTSRGLGAVETLLSAF
jgi:hypothetical protein